MRVALLIAAKDVRQRVRDRSALLISIAAPLGLALIFGAMLGNVTSFHATYAVADLDGGQLALVLRRDVIGALARADAATVTDVAGEQAARAAVENGEADTAFVIPAGFTAAIQGGRPVTLTLIGARGSPLETAVAQALGQRFGEGVVTAQLAVATTARLAGGPLSDAQAAAVAAQAAAATPPVLLADSTAPLRQLPMATYFSASMSLMFLFLASAFGVVSLFEERRRGTLARVLAGPTRPGEVLAGKTLSGIGFGLLAMAVLVIATTLLVGADWGPPAGVAALAVGAILSATGIATFVASLCRTEEAAGAATSAVAITLAILGGSFSPVTQAPEVMATLALLTPHGWFLRGLGDLHGAGAVWTDALLPTAVLAAIGLAFGALGLLRARRLVALG